MASDTYSHHFFTMHYARKSIMSRHQLIRFHVYIYLSQRIKMPDHQIASSSNYNYKYISSSHRIIYLRCLRPSLMVLSFELRGALLLLSRTATCPILRFLLTASATVSVANSIPVVRSFICSRASLLKALRPQ